MNKAALKFLLILMNTISSFCLLYPQTTQNIKFDHIGLEQGLSQSTVYAITQDAQGFMWFGTDDGLNRYDGYSITVFKHNPRDSNSIADNTVLSLLVDSNGELWIGTMQGGVDRYLIAENRFNNYTFQGRDDSLLNDSFVTSLFEDSFGNIWVGSNRGLYLLDRERDKFKQILNFKYEDTSSNNIIWNIYEDNTANLLLATQKGLFYLKLEELSSTSNEQIMQPYDLGFNQNNQAEDNIRAVCIASDGTYWVSNWGMGLYRLNEGTKVNKHYLNKVGESNSLPNNFIRALFEDSTGDLWIGTRDELVLYDYKANNFIRYATDGVTTFFKDRSGIIWIGTFNNGIKVYSKHRNRFNLYSINANSLNEMKGSEVFAILEDREGELWIGTLSNGLIHFDRKSKKIKKYVFNSKNKYSLSNNNVWTVCESFDNKIWIGTDDGLNYFDKNTGKFTRYKGISFNKVFVLEMDRNKNLWIGSGTGTGKGGIDRIQLETNKIRHYQMNEADPNSLSGTAIMEIYESQSGTIWIGTLGGGLHRYLPESDSFKRYRKLKGGISGINNNTILAIYECNNGFVWIGTQGGGLNKYDPVKDSFIYYTTKDGLSNDVIYGILPDKSGNLWLSTNKGISKFNPENEIFRNFDVNDGLQSNEFNQNATFVSSIGELFFGGVNGFNSFFPEEIEDNNYIPPVYLTQFKVFNETLPLPNPIMTNSQIELSHSQNFFSFEFVALNYTSPEKNQYAYMLEGFDKEWHYVSATQRYASYTNLDPGEYILHVKGSNNDELWNEVGTSIAIIITPPFWMTWWFKSLGIILLISLGFIVYQRRIKSLEKEKIMQQEVSSLLIKKQEEERQRVAQEMHDSIGQGLLFVKNHVTIMLEDDFEKSETKTNLNQISSYISGLLKTTREISHNLRPPELDRLGLTEALDTLLLNLSDSTSIKVISELDNIDGMIEREMEINIVRIVQEALGNIVKHSKASECRVSVVKQNANIFLNISDNGKGFEIHKINKKAGLGLSGMAERIRILTGTLNVNSEVGKGTRIEIEIPVTSENG